MPEQNNFIFQTATALPQLSYYFLAKEKVLAQANSAGPMYRASNIAQTEDIAGAKLFPIS
ncbi:hypothetical protein NE619_16830 [Anaerovorax odorimutans]|uniref:Uncharacterized protein n=1 Tax=Anaerovorax odorimutans TaxID=109327 RepID=A0ABT1RT90_9FIRM|nr:hypothetical protein [Anaerovorax odorimutans]